MVTEESLRFKYKQLATPDVMEIAANKDDYTELAIAAAIQELRSRNVPEDEIKNYHTVIAGRRPETLTANNIEDLNLLQKMIFYFLWIPRVRRFFTADFRPNQYVLKIHQANYYSVVGFCVLLVSCLFLRNNSASLFVVILIGGFIPVYIFDVGFNKARQIKQMEKKVVQKKNLWW